MELKKKELFESLLPEFFDEDALKSPPQITYRIDNQGERLYARKTDTGLKVVPSVSTILRNTATSPHLIQWYCDNFESYEAAQEHVGKLADYGTFMHMMFKEILLGKSLVFNTDLIGDSFAAYLMSVSKKPDQYDLRENGQRLKQDLYAFVLWCLKYKVKPLAIEYIVFGEQYAGAIDLVCKMTISKTRKVTNFQDEKMFAFLPEAGEVTEETEIIAMVDFKSGRKDFYDDNVLQLHAYRELWNQEWPQHQIEVIANYGCKDYSLPIGKSEPYRYKPHDKPAVLEVVKKKWALLVDLYHTEEIKIKDRVEFTDAGNISLEAPLSEMIQKVEVEKQLLERMEENGRTNTEGQPGDETAGDRENQDRPKGGGNKRKGAANQSGLF